MGRQGRLLRASSASPVAPPNQVAGHKERYVALNARGVVGSVHVTGTGTTGR